nr:MAG TPA: hypothetical protein [Caudoviricetes sp.]
MTAADFESAKIVSLCFFSILKSQKYRIYLRKSY